MEKKTGIAHPIITNAILEDDFVLDGKRIMIHADKAIEACDQVKKETIEKAISIINNCRFKTGRAQNSALINSLLHNIQSL